MITVDTLCIWTIVITACLLYTITRMMYEDNFAKPISNKSAKIRVIISLTPLNLIYFSWILIVISFIIFKNFLMLCSTLNDRIDKIMGI